MVINTCCLILNFISLQSTYYRYSKQLIVILLHKVHWTSHYILLQYKYLVTNYILPLLHYCNTIYNPVTVNPTLHSTNAKNMTWTWFLQLLNDHSKFATHGEINYKTIKWCNHHSTCTQKSINTNIQFFKGFHCTLYSNGEFGTKTTKI